MCEQRLDLPVNEIPAPGWTVSNGKSSYNSGNNRMVMETIGLKPCTQNSTPHSEPKLPGSHRPSDHILELLS